MCVGLGTAATPAVSPGFAQAPAAAAAEPPRNWHLLDESLDGLPGASVERAYRALAGRPARTVVVAIIDVGVDTTHPDLRANLWINPREIAGNGVDDDRDGYVDDVRGWSFLGGRDGRTVASDALEVTRLFARCTARGKGVPVPDPLAAGLPMCASIVQDFQAQRGAESRRLAQRELLLDTLATAVRQLQGVMGAAPVPVERLEGLRPTDSSIVQARGIVLRARQRFRGLRSRSTLEPADVEAERLLVRQSSRLRDALDPAFDPRAIVGDHYADVDERSYGNADVMGPGPEHGTHLAGIIGAVRGNGMGIDGVVGAVRLMIVHATTNGDERDKDVANAIRFAVDHGARVVNMSFGKPYSPEKAAVDAAVRHAVAHGVLIVHSAGNDAADLDQMPSYPSARYLDGNRAATWLEVGASSWQAGDALAASFSSYGRERVDLFAPGVDILSTAAGGGVERRSGTSQAAPVVAGVAALLMSYFPALTALEVKEILLASAARHSRQMVVRPGSSTGERIAFGALSRTGGIVDAYAAVLLAERASARHVPIRRE